MTPAERVGVPSFVQLYLKSNGKWENVLVQLHEITTHSTQGDEAGESGGTTLLLRFCNNPNSIYFVHVGNFIKQSFNSIDSNNGNGMIQNVDNELEY